MLTLHAHLPALICCATIVIALVMWFVPQLQARYSRGVSADNFFDRENNARKTLAQIIGGIFVLAGLYSSVKTFDLQQQSARLQQEGQITDRFSKAIDQLGSISAGGGTDRFGRPNINLEMRLGGIYALERIASDSPRDHWTIMEVLMTYVRENSPTLHPARQPRELPQQPKNKDSVAGADPPMAGGEMTRSHVRTDIQAILTVIGRRDTSLDPLNRQLDLSAADLTGASLKEGTFQNAILIQSNLSGSDLMDANLASADLENSNLEGASFVGANLRGAVLRGADLKGADLSGADLSGAIVTDEQLPAASGDADTKLPASVHRPASWGH